MKHEYFGYLTIPSLTSLEIKKEDPLKNLEILTETDSTENTSDIVIVSECLYELIGEYNQEEVLLDIFTKFTKRSCKISGYSLQHLQITGAEGPSLYFVGI